MHRLISFLIALLVLFCTSQPNVYAQRIKQPHDKRYCWFNSKTGKEMKTVAAGGAELDPTDPNRAFNPKTGDNYYRAADGNWFNSKTGKMMSDVAAGGAELDPTDPNRAFNPKTGDNYYRAPCPKETATAVPPPEEPKATPQPHSSKIKKVAVVVILGCLIATAIAVPIAVGIANHRHHHNNNSDQQVALFHLLRARQAEPPPRIETVP
jgi:hypothetical protein